MAVVYRSFEVREGYGARDEGALRFRSESRAEADQALEELSKQGDCAQIFGLRSNDAGDGERVLLRTLVARHAA